MVFRASLASFEKIKLVQMVGLLLCLILQALYPSLYSSAGHSEASSSL